MNYISETRDRYRDKKTAFTYQSGYDKGLNIKRMRNRLIAYFEKKAILRALSRCEGIKNILDMPCGTGKLSEILSERYETYVGVDISKEMMDEIKLERPINLVQADGTSMPFENNFFDASVSLRLIHRLPAQIKLDVLNELCRVSNNYVIFSFTKNSLYNRLLVGTKNLLRIGPEKIVMDAMKEYEGLLNVNGYRMVDSFSVLPSISNQHIFLFENIN